MQVMSRHLRGIATDGLANIFIGPFNSGHFNQALAVAHGSFRRGRKAVVLIRYSFIIDTTDLPVTEYELVSEMP